MNISSLRVINYRGLKDVTVPLSSFVCITGENNSGKSSVLQALSLFLSGSSIKATDFYDLALPVTMEVSLANVLPEDLTLLAEEHRDRIAALVQANQLSLVRRYDVTGKSQLGYTGLAPHDPKFASAHVNSIVAGKKGSGLKAAVLTHFPELTELTASSTQAAAKELIAKLGESLPADQKSEQFIPLPTGFDNSITPMLPERIYIPAVKDLADDTKAGEGSSFGRILAIVMKSIEPLLAEEKGLFEKLSKKLTRLLAPDGTVQDGRLDQIKRIETTIERYVRESFSNVRLEIEIPPPELKTVLSTARFLADDGMKGPLELKGDGLRRAVVFSILRTYVEFARAAAKSGTTAPTSDRGYLLLFEEPELFLHPDAQRVLFDALGVFAEKNHVVVTTHSPFFLGPEATATFIRLSKTTDAASPKPFTRSWPLNLRDIDPRDEFQIICYENNSAAFFARKIVLVEGDSDYIVFPHLAETLNADWNCRIRSVAFVRVGGKGSIARYRRFFTRFNVPVSIIADLDVLNEDFDKLAPSPEATALRADLLKKVDAVIAATEGPELKAETIKKAQAKPEIRVLWDAVRAARKAFEGDPTKFAPLNEAVTAFFAWEKKNLRRDCIQTATNEGVNKAKLALLWELRKSGVFVLEKGSIDDYYPPGITGPDKPSRAQTLRKNCVTREAVLTLSPKQTCPVTSQERHEFEFILEPIFAT